MKTLSDGIGVTERTWYYLLDFNDRNNWEFIMQSFNKTKLHDLTINEYKQLFIYATNSDIQLMFREDEIRSAVDFIKQLQNINLTHLPDSNIIKI
jgi:hypothetical protein